MRDSFARRYHVKPKGAPAQSQMNKTMLLTFARFHNIEGRNSPLAPRSSRIQSADGPDRCAAGATTDGTTERQRWRHCCYNDDDHDHHDDHARPGLLSLLFFVLLFPLRPVSATASATAAAIIPARSIFHLSARGRLDRPATGRRSTGTSGCPGESDPGCQREACCRGVIDAEQ